MRERSACSLTIEAAVRAMVPEEVLARAAPSTHAGDAAIRTKIAIDTAVSLGILSPPAADQAAEDLDAQIRHLVNEDLEAALITQGVIGPRFHELPPPLQQKIVKERLARGPVQHLYEYLRTSAMIRVLSAPFVDEDLEGYRR